MRLQNRLTPNDSNESIRDLVLSNNPFMVSRVGLGGETAVSVLTLAKQQIPQHVLNWFFINAGFYGSNNYIDYANLYKSACDTSDLHAYWHHQGFIELEDFLVPDNKKLIDPSALESFRFDNPWTKELKGKKVLIISPFKITIDMQLTNRDKIWKNPDVLPEANYVTYESVQSIGGSGPHKDWYESFEIMCDDISKIDFDIALLGCGSYGLPLCNYIKNKLNKSCVYVGGGLQLYFGIKGKRWDNGSDITQHYNEYWVRVDAPKNGNLVEGGCYW